MDDEELRKLATELTNCLSAYLTFVELTLFKKAVFDTFVKIRDTERKGK